jgi:hypothetical protein
MGTKERRRFFAQIPKNRVLFQSIVRFSLLRERLRNAVISSDMRHGSDVAKLESFLRLRRFSAGFSIMHTLHQVGKPMKEQDPLARIPNESSQSIWLPALLAAVALVASASPARAQYDQVITPDQFLFLNWGANLQWSTVGAYPGDGPNGDAWTANYGATPSASVLIPLPPGLPAGAHGYDLYEWIPTVHSTQFRLVEIADAGPLPPGIGEQFLQEQQNNQGGWLKLGPGPQTDPHLDNGYGVWITGGAGNHPNLQIHDLGFENGEESFDAFRLVQIDVVPEPSTIALGLLGGFALLARVSKPAPREKG